MFLKIFFLVLAASLAVSEGVQPTNYDISRNQLGGGNYGNYPYPSGPGYYPGGQYGGQYGPGQYGPGQYGPAGPPGAHPGCPLCDSSVYSYCYQKQAHDACCCGSVFNPYNCGKTNCKFLYANSCDEHQLITNCCCVDLFKNNPNEVPVAAVVA